MLIFIIIFTIVLNNSIINSKHRYNSLSDIENDNRIENHDFLDTAEGNSVKKNLKMSFWPQAEEVVSFILYTRLNEQGVELKRPFTNSNSVIIQESNVTILIHGWRDDRRSLIINRMKDALLCTDNTNVIVLDWSEVANNLVYLYILNAIKDVGQFVGESLELLADVNRIEPVRIHFIGHSLGAHLAGIAARNFSKGPIGRITGLDPARPGFEAPRLIDGSVMEKSDAIFIDIIHTAGGDLGVKAPMGHVDFYPNGGTASQPGCTISDVFHACSHMQSLNYFLMTMLEVNKNRFMARECSSSDEIDEEHCKGVEISMGYFTPWSARGLFHVKTEDIFLVYIENCSAIIETANGTRTS